jgi:hypothetical protein
MVVVISKPLVQLEVKRLIPGGELIQIIDPVLVEVLISAFFIPRNVLFIPEDAVHFYFTVFTLAKREPILRFA